MLIALIQEDHLVVVARSVSDEAIQKLWIYPFGHEGKGEISQPRRFSGIAMTQV